MPSTKLTIGKLADETGVKVVTIRYYEKIGLMPAAPRTDGNYRIYGLEHRRRLHFIRRCRGLGFTLDQVRDLLRLSSEKTQACAEVDRIAEQHRRTVEEKLADLTRLASELRRLSACCRGKGLIADCRIIEALSPNASPTRPARRTANVGEPEIR
jgi:DNA-binding transcriptional MerR regulator